MITKDTISFNIGTESGVVSADLHGIHTANTMINCITKVHEEQQFKLKSEAVFDMKDAELHESFGDLLQMIDFTNTIGSVTGPTKWAFISTERNSSEFLDQYITLAKDSPIQIKRFQRPSEAHQWLSTQDTNHKSFLNQGKPKFSF